MSSIRLLLSSVPALQSMPQRCRQIAWTDLTRSICASSRMLSRKPLTSIASTREVIPGDVELHREIGKIIEVESLLERDSYVSLKS